MMPFELSTLAIVPAGINVTVKGIQTTYELQAVPAETQAVFKLIDSTKLDILKAREKRLVLAKTCELEDLTEWDRSVSDTEAALLDLEKLLEPARLDIRHNNGKLRVKTKCLWVLRDSKSLSATSDRLLLAHQRMLSAQLMTRIECDQERREQGRPPPPYTIPKGVIKKAADELRKGDNARAALENSLRIVRDDDTILRPPSPVQTVAESTMSARKRAFDALFERHEHTRTLSQMHPVRVPESVVEVQQIDTSHSNMAPLRQEHIHASIRSLRRPVPSTSLPNLIQTSALRRHDTPFRPQPRVVPPVPSRSPSPILPPSPPRSPSPFQEETGDSPRQVIELEAIPVSPNRVSPATRPDRQHQEFARRVNFRERSRPQVPDTPSPNQARYRRQLPYPTTDPPTPDARYVTPYTHPFHSRHPQTPSPSSNEGKGQAYPKQRPSPTSASTDPGPSVFGRTSGAGAPPSIIAPSSTLAHAYTHPDTSHSYRPPSPHAPVPQAPPSATRPSRTHPPLSYRPPPNEFAAALGRIPGTSTGAPRSTISSVASLIGPSGLTGISALDLQMLTASPPATSPPDNSSTTTNAYGLRSVPHMFAGHRRPVNIRYNPETENSGEGDGVEDSGQGDGRSPRTGETAYPFSPATVGVRQDCDEGDGNGAQTEQRDWVYMPYRPT